MFKFGMKSDTIQFWILIVGGLGILGSFASWCDARYYHADKGNEIAWEVHQVYQKVLSPQERDKLEHSRDQASQ